MKMIKFVLTTILLLISAVSYAHVKVDTNQMIEVSGQPAQYDADSIKKDLYFASGSDFGANAGVLQFKIFGVTYYSDSQCTQNPRTVDQNTNSWATFPRFNLASKSSGALINPDNPLHYYVSSLNLIDQDLAGDYQPVAGGCAKIDFRYRTCTETDPANCPNNDMTVDSSDSEYLTGSAIVTCSDFQLTGNDITDCTMNAGYPPAHSSGLQIIPIIHLSKQGELDVFPASREYGPNTTKLQRQSFKGRTSGVIVIKNTGTTPVNSINISTSEPFTSYFTNDCPTDSSTGLAPHSSCTIVYNKNNQLNSIAGFGDIVLTGLGLSNDNYVFPFRVTNNGYGECFGALPKLGPTLRPRALTNSQPMFQLNSSSLSDHTCATLPYGDDKSVAACWGNNNDGQLGNNQSGDSTGNALVYVHTSQADTTPLGADTGASPIVEVTAGYGFSCALSEDGYVQCWGSPSYGALGNGISNNQDQPYPTYVCKAHTSSAGCQTNPDDRLSDVIQISSSDKHTCALTKFGSVKCWGSNSHGQLGNGTKGEGNKSQYDPLPVVVSGLNAGVADITSGNVYSCATMQNGTAKCWGDNISGQLGNHSTSDSNIPVDVCATSSTVGICDEKLEDISFIKAGYRTTCARMKDGTVKCWGSNSDGIIGSGSSTPDEPLPRTVSGLSSVASLKLGYDHACALDVSGKLYCWGSNYFGQFGNGQSGQGHADNNTPVSLDGDWYNMTVGQQFTCATSKISP